MIRSGESSSSGPPSGRVEVGGSKTRCPLKSHAGQSDRSDDQQTMFVENVNLVERPEALVPHL